MDNENVVMLDKEASSALTRMIKRSGMTASELLSIAVIDLENSRKIWRKAKHEKLMAVVRDALGEDSERYDVDAMARAFEHEPYYGEHALEYGLQLRTDRYGEQYLNTSNFSITVDRYVLPITIAME